MTIIALALNSDRQLVLVADRVYAPFSNPQFMRKAKIFRRGSIVVGVSGDICAVDLEKLLEGNLIEKPTSKAHIIMIDEDSNRVMIAKPCGDDSFSTWFDPILTGEPVTIGCFAHIVDAGVYGSIPPLALVLDRIHHLHLAFGYNEAADTIELNIDHDIKTFDSLVDNYFRGESETSAAFRGTTSTGMPFADYSSNKDLLSGCLSSISADDIERLARNVVKLYDAATKGRVQP